MKITKSQKEAIVNEITRRLKKENQTITENFNKNYKFTKEEKKLMKNSNVLQQKVESLLVNLVIMHIVHLIVIMQK